MSLDQSRSSHFFDYSDSGPDKEVVDVEELPQPLPLRPRVATKDLTVHVCLDDGLWHRLHPTTVKTACGIAVNFWRCTTRTGRHAEHPLAQCECWTSMERTEADDAYRAKFDAEFKP